MNEQMDRYPNPSEIRHRIGAQGSLTINNVSGEVEIRATDGDEVVSSRRRRACALTDCRSPFTRRIAL